MRSEAWAVLPVVLLLVISFAVQPSLHDDEDGPTLEMDAGSVFLHYSLPGDRNGYPATVMALPVQLYRMEDAHVLLDSEGYSVTDTEAANLQGLIDHLSAELNNIGSSRDVVSVDRQGLIPFFAAGNGTLIIATSIWNDPELCQLADDWVLNGGVLVCIGPCTVPMSKEVGGSLELRFAALDLGDGNGTVGTPFSEALGLRTIAPVNCPVVQDILDAGGMVLGQVYDREENLTTLAMVPYGLGSLLIFGGPIDAPFRASMEDVVAWDLARCLEAGAPFCLGDPTYISLTVGAEGAEGTMMVTGPFSPAYSLVWQSLDDAHMFYEMRAVVL